MADKLVDYKSLGRRVQERRLQLKLTQSDAAEKLDLSTSFLGRVERGEKVASLETLIKIVNAWACSPNFLLQDSVKKDLSDKLQTELSQIFMDKTPEQSRLLLKWIRVLADNLDRLS